MEPAQYQILIYLVLMRIALILCVLIEESFKRYPWAPFVGRTIGWALYFSGGVYIL